MRDNGASGWSEGEVVVGRFHEFVNAYYTFREGQTTKKKRHLAEKSKELDNILEDWPKRDLYSLWQNANRRSWFCAYIGGVLLCLRLYPAPFRDGTTLFSSICSYGMLLIGALIFSFPIFIIPYAFCILTKDIYNSFKLNLVFSLLIPLALFLWLGSPRGF